jgi:hypothetical protein
MTLDTIATIAGNVDSLIGAAVSLYQARKARLAADRAEKDQRSD